MVENYIIPQLKTNTDDLINSTLYIRKEYDLPEVHTTGYSFDEADKLNEVLMATGQLIALLEGLSGSFENEINKLKEEKKQLEDELKSVKPLFPSMS